MVDAVLAPGERVANDHETGALQLAVEFPIDVYINVPVSLNMQPEKSQGGGGESSGLHFSSVDLFSWPDDLFRWFADQLDRRPLPP